MAGAVFLIFFILILSISVFSPPQKDPFSDQSLGYDWKECATTLFHILNRVRTKWGVRKFKTISECQRRAEDWLGPNLENLG